MLHLKVLLALDLPPPHQLNTGIPMEELGDLLMILEFLQFVLVLSTVNLAFYCMLFQHFQAQFALRQASAARYHLGIL